MTNKAVLITITDGCDNCDDDGRDFERAVGRLRAKGALSLSCGIGQVDVDHAGLARLAEKTGGLHIAVLGSQGIADALADLTEFLHVRVASVAQQRSTDRATMVCQAALASACAQRVAVDGFLLIDCSWSMFGLYDHGDWSGDREKIVRTKESACALIDSLNAQYDRVGVVRFWEEHEVLCPLTDDFEMCKRRIRRIEGGYGTGLYRAIAAVAGML